MGAGDNRMIREFTDLTAWQASRALAVVVYLQTRDFPKDEQYALTSQIRRAATSSAANIAEGFGRMSKKDQDHFYTMALGSLTELKSHILIAHDLDYLDGQSLTKLLNQHTTAIKLLRGLIRAHRSST